MPLTQTQPSAATRIYARSLFDLAMAKGGRQAVEEIADELAQIVELAAANPRLGDILASPTIAREEREKSIERLFKGRVSDTTFRFMSVLNDKGRAGEIAGVAASFDEIVQEKFGLVEVDVFTAQPATPDMTRDLAQRLERSLGKQVVVHNYTDPQMIGGVKIKIGDQLLDGSIATQLRRLKDKLDSDAGANLRAQIGRILEA
ncbi:MAG TPA: ATP synthase F1 subunit delta [Phycisphaerales bacterium]|nr:ATP synthase F1 subunit delta [Phycisphaerales bacterium]